MSRPDPDALLDHVRAEEERTHRGHLTVFLGAAPGVGKTWAMLMEARQARQQGRDVVVGLVETHGRADTTALLDDLEVLPRREVVYRGIGLSEFDLDAAIVRRPALLLVDELAHSNAPDSRHPKRWMDVEECLDAGLDVLTALNVQHVESLKDLVARITGVTVRENVPDRFVAGADDVRVVDLPPDDLLRRLREGKVYLPEQAGRAAERFFQKGNLIALRELALRFTAERVDADVRAWRLGNGVAQTRAVSGRLLVAVSPSPFSTPLIRTACRMARSLGVPWQAVYVDDPTSTPLGGETRKQLVDNLHLAQSLGGEVITLSSDDPAKAIIAHARRANLTQIIAGKPRMVRWRDRVFGSFVDRLVRASGEIDVYVTSVETAIESVPVVGESVEPSPSGILQRLSWMDWLVPPVAVATATSGAYFLFGRQEPADAVMVYLLAILLVSLRQGFAVSLASAVLSVLAFDVFFIPPYLSIHVTDVTHIVTFGVMLAVAVVISGLTGRLRRQAQVAQLREHRTATLYALSRDLGQAGDREAAIIAGARHLAGEFACEAGFYRLDEASLVLSELPGGQIPAADEQAAIRWVWMNNREAGAGTDTLGLVSWFYLPLSRTREKVGVLGLHAREAPRWRDPEDRLLLDAMTAQIGLALERAQADEEAARACMAGEREALRSTLLRSVSHDLRTPLASIVGASSGLVEEAALDLEQRRELALTIHEEARRLDRLVRNLLDMTRLESGALRLSLEWQPLEEVVGAALSHLEERLRDHEVRVDLPVDLPLLRLDAVLMDQVFVNLLENVVRHTPPGTSVDIAARVEDRGVVVDMADRGPGVPDGEEESIFARFQRASSPTDRAGGGVGLGLAICRAAVVAHGGTISAMRREGGGAIFRIVLPAGKAPSPGDVGVPPQE